MVTAFVAAFALVVVGVLLVAVRYLNLRSGRQTEAILGRIDGHLEAISTSVAQAVDRIVEARRSGPQLLPTLDFDALVEALLAEAATRTGADAVVLRVEGPGRRPSSHRSEKAPTPSCSSEASTPRTARSFRAPRQWIGRTRRSTMPRRPLFGPPSLRRSTSAAKPPGPSPSSRDRTTPFERSRQARSARSSKRPRSRSRTRAASRTWRLARSSILPPECPIAAATSSSSSARSHARGGPGSRSPSPSSRWTTACVPTVETGSESWPAWSGA